MLCVLGLLSHKAVLLSWFSYSKISMFVKTDISIHNTLSYFYQHARLTSFRSELCSWTKSLWRVWTEAVAVFFREWRELRIWVRGSIIWQIQKRRMWANSQSIKMTKYTIIHTNLFYFNWLKTQIIWRLVAFRYGVCYVILIWDVYTCSDQQGAVWPPYVRHRLYVTAAR